MLDDSFKFPPPKNFVSERETSFQMHIPFHGLYFTALDFAGLKC